MSDPGAGGSGVRARQSEVPPRILLNSKEFDLQHPSGLRIHRGLSEVDTENTPGVSRSDMQTGYVWYRLPTSLMGSQRVAMSLCFFKRQFDSISLAVSEERFGLSWNDWSESKERDRTEATRLWLEEIGYPVGEYSWGRIWAEFDAKGGSGGGGVRFNIAGVPNSRKRRRRK